MKININFSILQLSFFHLVPTFSIFGNSITTVSSDANKTPSIAPSVELSTKPLNTREVECSEKKPSYVASFQCLALASLTNRLIFEALRASAPPTMPLIAIIVCGQYLNLTFQPSLQRITGTHRDTPLPMPFLVDNLVQSLSTLCQFQTKQLVEKNFPFLILGAYFGAAAKSYFKEVALELYKHSFNNENLSHQERLQRICGSFWKSLVNGGFDGIIMHTVRALAHRSASKMLASLTQEYCKDAGIEIYYWGVFARALLGSHYEKPVFQNIMALTFCLHFAYELNANLGITLALQWAPGILTSLLYKY